MKRKIITLIFIMFLVFAGCQDSSISDSESFILNLPPMKGQFAGKFLIGNIFNPGDASGSSVTNPFLTRHFNVLTCENNMKPSYLAPSKDSYSFTTADTMVNAAIASGFKVVGHTLLWHSQNPPSGWMNSANLNDMKKYITDVVEHFKGRIYSWDVLNEVFPDGVSASADWKNVMRTNNPWYATIGSNFVYEGFLAARLADPDAILYYNDYNTDQVGKATMIRNMVRDVNNQYLASTDKPTGEDPNRLLIEGIGMQEHHNTGVQASSVKNTLTMFRNMAFTGSDRKIIVSVTELDILSQSWNQYSGNAAITAEGRAAQTKLYGDLMKVYLEFSDIIERVSLWGVTDDKSWRSRGEPLLFKPNGEAKPSYYSFVGALSQ
ncbi:MAG: endo-1,4-beta-xylanase [Treponema sp.]|nr:endo-1,4-beta-xylanase [Treponema sp.]